jgi:hypothetical protein
MAKLGFVGLGVMGYPMAGHLRKKGHAVTVYNRTAAKAQKWVAEFGGAFAVTPRAVAEGQDFVFACVGNDDDLRGVALGADGAFAGLGSGAVFVDHTTASAAVARELADIAAANGQRLHRRARLGRPGRRRKRRAFHHVRRRPRRLCARRADHRRLRQGGAANGSRRLRAIDQNGQSDLHRRTGRGAGRRASFRQMRRSTRRPSSRRSRRARRSPGRWTTAPIR